MSSTREYIEVDIRRTIFTIGHALNYVGIDSNGHGHRVGYIAYECAKKVGWASTRQEYILLAGMLHDCGVESGGLMKADAWKTAFNSPEKHCHLGYEYLSQCTLLQTYATPVKYHHTPWSDLNDLDIDGPDKECAAMLYLADQLDDFSQKLIGDNDPDTITKDKHKIIDFLNDNAGTKFEPTYVEAMIDLVKRDGFWFTMDQSFIEDIGMQMGKNKAFLIPLSLSQIANLSNFIARLVDAKSPFTSEHSNRVDWLARELSEDMGFPKNTQQKIEIAGLLHDLGKLRTSEALLNKPGKLDDSEYSKIKRHVVDTWLGLRYFIKDLKIPEWAANHHEKLDGSGYPWGLKADELDTPSRIIAVADIFQALTQERPYRGRMSFETVDEIMTGMVKAGQLDAEIYAKLQARSNDYYELSTS